MKARKIDVEIAHVAPTKGAPLLEVNAVHYDYRGVGAVAGCSLTVHQGDICALVGSNGAGKSTLVKLIAGALRPQSGQIRFEGHDIGGLPAHQVVARGIALVPEGRLVFPQLSVRENLLLAGHVPRARAGLAHNLARVWQRFPRLAERQRQSAGSLSGGEQQMLAIGRALMTGPRLVIFDESSLGLSPMLVGTLFALMQTLNDEGMTLLIVEQNVHQALALAAVGYVLEKGRVVQSGTGQALLHDPRVVEAYLGRDVQ